METLQRTVRTARLNALTQAATEIAEARRQYREKVANFLTAHPTMTYQNAADHFQMSRSFVNRIAQEFNIKRPKGRPKKEK